MRKKDITELNKAWVQGFMAACAIAVEHGDENAAEGIFQCNFMKVADMKKHEVDQFDIDRLTPLVEEIIDREKRMKELWKRRRLNSKIVKS